MRLGDELEHLELSRSQELAGLRAVARLFEVVADERGDSRRIDERLTSHGCPACFDQVTVGRGFKDVAGGARLERFEEVLLVVMHGEHQQPELGLAS